MKFCAVPVRVLFIIVKLVENLVGSEILLKLLEVLVLGSAKKA